MGTQDRADLTQRLESHKPAAVLAIGPRAAALLLPYQSAHAECRITLLDADGDLDAQSLLHAVAACGRFDFVVVRGVLERIDKQSGAHFLACLRDVHTRRFCVALAATGGGQHWTAAELVAMGLDHWPAEIVDETRLEIYGFDLGTYKATPAWLNPRYWAHPEHWGKFRW
jgi:hypothetical protein